MQTGSHVIDTIFAAKTHCQVLEIDPKDVHNKSLVKKAFRKLSLKIHPDKNSDPRAKDAFLHITTSYDYLVEWGKDSAINAAKTNWSDFMNKQSQQKQNSERTYPTWNYRKPEPQKSEFEQFWEQYQRKTQEDEYDSELISAIKQFRTTNIMSEKDEDMDFVEPELRCYNKTCEKRKEPFKKFCKKHLI